MHSLFELIEKYELLLRDQDAEKSEIRNLDQQIRRDLKFFWAGKPVEIEQGFVRSLYEERLDGDFWIEKELCLEEELESLNSQRRELKQNDDDPNEEATVTE
ncbi:MAG: hypothetical protein R3C02_15895 [Planctomycetaceae bacterium]